MSISQPTELKEEGNRHFLNKAYSEALACYLRAIEGLRLADEDVGSELDDGTSPFRAPRSAVELACLANSVACYLALERYSEAVSGADAALAYDPKHAKCLRRRSEARARLENFEQAIADAEQLVAIADDAGRTDAEMHLARLKSRREAHNTEKQAEMMTQLKDLGNQFLNIFGLSVDNFSTQKNPEDGSYKIQFKDR